MSERDGAMTFDVVIIGAGPSGLAAAIELGQRGVSCIVLERNDRVGYSPRAKTTHSRTREHLRRWGIAKNLLEASPFGADYPSDVVFATRLSGHVITRFENAFACAPERQDIYSEHAQWIPQYKLEAVLHAHLATLDSVTLRFNCRFDTATQDERGVRVVFTDEAGHSKTINARYLIGADGAGSNLRRLMGIEMRGERDLSTNTIVICRAPGLVDRVKLPRAIMYWLVNPDVPGNMAPMDVDDIWAFSTQRHITTEAEAKALINAVSGIEVDAEILRIDHWTAHALIADRYRDRNFFLIGDACHLHPPYGGFGMNMGIGDGIDLGWKMAALLQGWGGEVLLESYEIERRQVHELVIAEAATNQKTTSKNLVVASVEDEGPAGEAVRAEVNSRIVETKSREFRTLGVVLGARYATSPIVIADGSLPPPWDSAIYTPNAVPGSRAPHLWLEPGTAPGASLFDRFGPDYTLLVLNSAAEADAEKFVESAVRIGVPVTKFSVHRPEAQALYEKPLVLIRPDQHVAWRGDEFPSHEELLDSIAGRGR
ncbi:MULTISPECIES: FAD-dependent oxidoreductase [unclassified Beijerinckia]|uniref:FAD-dependent oxidoreductase n=1 Tax=unclassified Beijerinckia TaxID=2638183 RepID=UPI00089ADDFA|nr:MULTISPECIES: FAD-dependent oxidoreductase [unclassified Beijerinckia]MDH7797650.1 2-polyprenyl-6-methoxyphenol hydroxylase-like FAD-dependent oxidoreductase [Beijerinckia sp. GAS462]SEC93722.1 2-polyprenyl-6-methoxyphenol hydroxylase [Beijerinckia sp. 28-YEA-48]